MGGAAFAYERLYDGDYVCVMRRGHALARSTSKRNPLTLDQFCEAHHLLVSFSGRPFGFVDEALASLARKRRIVLTVNQFFTAGRVVANSDLLTVLPRHFVRVADGADALVLRELPFAMPLVHVDALWHHRTTPPAPHTSGCAQPWYAARRLRLRDCCPHAGTLARAARAHLAGGPALRCSLGHRAAFRAVVYPACNH